ncbi:644e1067-dc88-469b-a6f6-1958840de30a [Thermothielavioides terrestris]|uniref:Uncharacterized protein n=2 Tax=Thermothielavioides terrestris TaxID=2587410 RepID=G2R8S7_THETT|nr:uncharacterized protein THITE_2117756 [Thermothielavioides terrestris NRRL 8126]AEO68293.1 hypothetical protein THITE_2117756 [Thermothielavioides terrestris NRRL 8126]SPQ24449.1 644e1067-dc88-469b-a6f6-1958840de30a [Thermothielavioides terrestris]
MTDSPFSTPKRKRCDMLNDATPKLNTSVRFTFDVNPSSEDGNASPRTRVARRFRGLALDGGGGDDGRSAEPSMVDSDVEDGARKRVKLPDIEMHDAESLPAAEVVAPAAEPTSQPQRQPPYTFKNDASPSRPRFVALDDAVVEQSETIANTSPDEDENTGTSTSTPVPDSPPPSVTHLPFPPLSPQARSRPRRRAGTPPFPYAVTVTNSNSNTDPIPKPKSNAKRKPKRKTRPPTTTPSKPTITDPLRASLTWHDDEITVYDPDDSDDDGTGINGIGFKPTPAIAHARALRRRQQLAEYRKREEREARAKRSLRRRGREGSSGGGGSGGSPAPPAAAETAADAVAGGWAGKKGKRERRRVRFVEREVAREREGAGDLTES